MKIKVVEYSDWWECGDGCCSHYDEVSIFTYEGKEYEYRGYDSELNLLKFLEEVLGISFDVTYEDRSGDVE